MFASPASGNSAPSLGHSLFFRAYGTHKSTHRGPMSTTARGYLEGAELGGLTLPGATFAEADRGRHSGYHVFWPNNKDKPDALLEGDSLQGSTQACRKEPHN